MLFERRLEFLHRLQELFRLKEPFEVVSWNCQKHLINEAPTQHSKWKRLRGIGLSRSWKNVDAEENHFTKKQNSQEETETKGTVVI